MSIDLEAIYDRAAAASPGPWQNAPDTGAGRVWVQRHRFSHHAKLNDMEPLFSVRGDDEYAQRAADAEFIAHARTDVPDLVKIVGKVQALHACVRRDSMDGDVISWCNACDTDWPCTTWEAVATCERAGTGE